MTDYSPHLVTAHRIIRDLNDLLPQKRNAEAEQLALKAIHELSKLIAAIHKRSKPTFAEYSEPNSVHDYSLFSKHEQVKEVNIPRARMPGQY